MFTLRKHFNLNLSMVPGDQCGNTAQTVFAIDATVTAHELCPAGYVVDNYLITDESLQQHFASAPLWRGSCEQLAAMVAAWLAAHCDGRVHNVTVTIENSAVPAPANSRITYQWQPGCDCPTLTPVYPKEQETLCPAYN